MIILGIGYLIDLILTLPTPTVRNKPYKDYSDDKSLIFNIISDESALGHRILHDENVLPDLPDSMLYSQRHCNGPEILQLHVLGLPRFISRFDCGCRCN